MKEDDFLGEKYHKIINYNKNHKFIKSIVPSASGSVLWKEKGIHGDPTQGAPLLRGSQGAPLTRGPCPLPAPGRGTRGGGTVAARSVLLKWDQVLTSVREGFG